MKRAIIIGVEGQDGRYLYDLLCKLDYQIVGIDKAFTVYDNIEGSNRVDIRDFKQISALVKSFKPDEIYYLAAYHHSAEEKTSEELSLFHNSMEVNVNGVMNCLESIREYSKKSRMFYAASYHSFGFSGQRSNDENTPLNPESIYAISKTTAIHLCKYYRRKHKMHVSIGYLYNHESPLRKKNYLSRKVVHYAQKISDGKEDTLLIGNLKAELDWGYAKEYVDAMQRILQLEIAEDFVICSNNIATVLDYVKAVFLGYELDYKGYVKEVPEVLEKEGTMFIPGDNRKLRRHIGWEAETSFADFVRIMINGEKAT